jgi:Fe-Mn family superoxide dismutase
MIENYTAKEFVIPELVGITKQNIEEHIKLYQGYVKHANLIQEKLNTLSVDDAYLRAELQRRFSFEFCGMRNHELYFWALTGSASPVTSGSKLELDIVRDFGSMENFQNRLREVAMTRGIGWVVLSYDTTFDHLILSWVDEQHIGQLMNVFPVYAIDMWEHSYVSDYLPSGKKNYVEDYIKNTNFDLISKRYEAFLTNLKPL